MKRLKYRNAKQADLESIVSIYNTTVASRMVTADTAIVSVESKQKWFDEHNATNRPLWIIENNRGETIGWVSFQSFYGRPAYEATAEISLYLAENQRGRGLGFEILQYCMAEAPKFGIKTLLGYIFSHNIPSVKLFEKLGFEEWAFLPNVAMLDGEERNLKIFGKRIA